MTPSRTRPLPLRSRVTLSDGDVGEVIGHLLDSGSVLVQLPLGRVVVVPSRVLRASAQASDQPIALTA